MKPKAKKKPSKQTASRKAKPRKTRKSGNPIRGLEEKIGYSFKNPALLRQALTHPSFQPEGAAAGLQNNQRLEFLGDSVLELILSERLYSLYPEAREGELTRYRSSLAKGAFLSRLARDMKLGDHLYLSRGEIESGGRDRGNLLEDALEALVGAIYLDAGLASTRRVVLHWYGDIRKRMQEAHGTENPKGRLQEEIQAVHGEAGPEYRVVTEEGPSHDRRFEVEVLLQNSPLGRGQGSSKKEAETQAAENALEYWRRRASRTP